MHFKLYNICKYKTLGGRTLVMKGKAIARINLVFPDRVVNLDNIFLKVYLTYF